MKLRSLGVYAAGILMSLAVVNCTDNKIETVTVSPFPSVEELIQQQGAKPIALAATMKVISEESFDSDKETVVLNMPNSLGGYDVFSATQDKIFQTSYEHMNMLYLGSSATADTSMLVKKEVEPLLSVYKMRSHSVVMAHYYEIPATEEENLDMELSGEVAPEKMGKFSVFRTGNMNSELGGWGHHLIISDAQIKELADLNKVSQLKARQAVFSYYTEHGNRLISKYNLIGKEWEYVKTEVSKELSK